METNELLKVAVSEGASDLHIKVGSTPIIRVDGELMPMTSMPKLSQEDALKLAFSVMSPGTEGDIQKEK